MEKIIEYKGIVFGFTDEPGYGKAIIASKDGVSKLSMLSIGINERMVKFIEYNGSLYFGLSHNDATNGYRIMKLDTINSGVTDTWSTAYATTQYQLDGIEYFEDYLYLFVKPYGGNIRTQRTDFSTVPTLMLSPFGTNIISVYDTVYIKNKIFVLCLDNINLEKIYEYDGNIIATLITSYAATGIKFPTGYNPIGKKLLVEYKGKIYYMRQGVFPVGTEAVYSYNIDTGVFKLEYTLGSVVTVMKLYNGMIMLGTYDIVTQKFDVKVFVIDEYEIDTDLVAGEGAVSGSLTRVDSDPIFLVKDANQSKMNPYTTFPVIATLNGKLNSVVKYCNRIEFYTDINDIFELVEMNIKDLMDKLCSLTDNFFRVGGTNIAEISKRDMIGNSDAFMTIKNNNDYGNNYVKNVEFTNQFPINFRRITVNWTNNKYSENNPAVVGSSDTQGFATFEFDSNFVNNPILAKNIGLYMLNRLSASENLNVDLSFSHFLDGGENLVFDINEEYVYIDDTKEWKLNKVIHNFADKTTKLELVERNIVNEIANI